MGIVAVFVGVFGGRRRVVVELIGDAHDGFDVALDAIERLAGASGAEGAEQVDGDVDDLDAGGRGEEVVFGDFGEGGEVVGEGLAQIVGDLDGGDVGVGLTGDGFEGEDDGQDGDGSGGEVEEPGVGVGVIGGPGAAVAEAEELAEVGAGDGGEQGDGFRATGRIGASLAQVVVEQGEGFGFEVEGDTEGGLDVAQAGLGVLGDGWGWLHWREYARGEGMTQRGVRCHYQPLCMC